MHYEQKGKGIILYGAKTVSVGLELRLSRRALV